MFSIHRKAKIGKNNILGYGVKIGPNVEIGDDNHIGDFVSIYGKVLIGNRNYIGTGSVIGGVSNHVLRKTNVNFQSVATNKVIRIGNENLLGEFVTIHTPVLSLTSVGNHINIGTRTHIAHDVIIEDDAIISIHCGLGGHVKILQGANIGIGVNIHPRIVVGQFSMTGLSSSLIRHILPCATVAGNPQRFIKPNLIGMERNGLTIQCIEELSWYLNQEKVDLKILSEKVQNILSHFLETIKNNKYVRQVSCIPSNVSII